jgi:hypothetical protein
MTAHKTCSNAINTSTLGQRAAEQVDLDTVETNYRDMTEKGRGAKSAGAL